MQFTKEMLVKVLTMEKPCKNFTVEIYFKERHFFMKIIMITKKETKPF